MTEALLETLNSKRIFNVFIPDVTLAEAQKNQQYVLRVKVPRGHRLLSVLQIASPLSGLGALAGAPQVAYAFLCDPTQEEERCVYITAVFSEQVFPWHDGSHVLYCEPIGVTTHNGVPLLHVRVEVCHERYAIFEEELKEAGYLIVQAKPYTQAGSLLEMYRAAAPVPSEPG